MVERWARALLIVLCAAAHSAHAKLVFPESIERGVAAKILFRLDRPVTGKGALAVTWTDADGRLVERTTIPVTLTNGAEIAFSLDTRRAVAVLNRLEVHFKLAGEGERQEAAMFIVSPPEPAWRDYHIVMWQRQSPAALAFLKGIGVDAGMVHADRGAPDKIVMEELGPLIADNQRFYVENIATDFYSSYHRYTPGRPVNWRFAEAQNLYRANPRDPAALIRDPPLDDPDALAQIRARVMATVRAHARYRPLYYNLADEAGIADLAAYWDFDFSDPSLAGLREWLRGEYPSLAALNAEWGTEFSDWDHVRPATTPEAMQRQDGNFASWADMKAWMDVAFARAFRAGSDAVHAADPHAVAALEGAQVPGWGGYDFSLLAHAVDAMEIYDGGDNVAMVHAFNPDATLITTSFDAGPAEQSQVWRELLRGARGLVVWDENGAFVQEDGTPGPRGTEAASYFPTLRDGIGALIVNSRAAYDPVAILYSPASMRTQWMLDWKDRGDAWLERGSEAEGGDIGNTTRAAVRGFTAAFAHLGLVPRFVTPAEVAQGGLARGGYRMLVLADAIALSAAEVQAVRAFAASGGIVVADREPGVFDAHSRRLETPPLSALFAGRDARGIYFMPRLLPGNAVRADPDTLRGLGAILAAHGLTPPIPIARPDGTMPQDVVMHRFRDGDLTILGLQRDYVAGAEAEPIALVLPRPAYVYDLVARKPLGHVARLQIALDPVVPTILALSDAPMPPPAIAGPRAMRLGATATFRLRAGAKADAALHVLHVEVTDPGGKAVAHYSGNVLAPGGDGRVTLPLALNDPTGQWRIELSDVTSGTRAVMALRVMR